MYVSKIKNTTLSLYEKLKGYRVIAELKDLQRHANKVRLVKSFLATAVLAAAIAMLIVMAVSSIFWAASIGVIIVSVFALYHYNRQHSHTKNLFERAKLALQQLTQ